MTGPVAPAAERNREPILDVLKVELANCKSVLEIGSGTGQHAVWFAAAMPWLFWQTSDLVENHTGINQWIDSVELPNVGRPLVLDVRNPGVPEQRYDAVFSANTAHIMGIDAVESMFTLVGGLVSQAGLFCLYGPFNRDGQFTSESNQRFDESLRRQNSAMGIRDLGQLDGFAHAAGMSRLRLHEMPANNAIAVWGRDTTGTEE